MSIKEVFPNPTVKQVIFQIRFPALFFLEEKIGEYQVKVMKLFPNSSLLFRKQFMFTDVGPSVELKDVLADKEPLQGAKVWQFRSENDTSLNITNESLDISSTHHKTYMLEKGGDKFRDIIKLVVASFLEVTKIPVISRVGLRYIDECPVPSKENEAFRAYYNSAFPLERFDLKEVSEMDVKAVAKKGPYDLRYIESLRKVEEGYKLIMDFDGYSGKIDAKEYLTTTDKLHKIISDEFERSIKKPLIQFMRGKKETKSKNA
jgi:uncharacterized protein (TIGR04255 family)